MEETVVCMGCGAPLQSEAPDHPGYLPDAARSRPDAVCRRCFRIRHYGEFTRVTVSPDEYAWQVSQVLSQPGLVLYILDVFDLHGSFVPDLPKYIGDAPVFAVVNKVDLLPSEVRSDKLSQWIRPALVATGIHPQGLFYVSAETGAGLEELEQAVESSGWDRVYVVGMANVGKSTLLNRMLRTWAGRQPFTMSRLPGTTLGLVAVHVNTPSGRALTVIDTPGLIRETRVIDQLCGDCLKTAIPRARLRPRVYQLDPEQSLWIGNFARFDFVEGPHQPFVVYVSNELVVHRTKLANAESFGRLHADDILKVPCPACRARLGELIRRPVLTGRAPRGAAVSALHLPSGRGGDVVLAGLGWIAQFGRPFVGTLWLPGGIDAATRPRLI